MSEHEFSRFNGNVEKDGYVVVDPDADIEWAADLQEQDDATNETDDFDERARVAAEAVVDHTVEYEKYSQNYYTLVELLDQAYQVSNQKGFGAVKVETEDKGWVEIRRYVATTLSKVLSEKAITAEEYLLLNQQAARLAEQLETKRNPSVEITKDQQTNEDEKGCECDCGQCQGGGGIHCHKEQTGCYV